MGDEIIDDVIDYVIRMLASGEKVPPPLFWKPVDDTWPGSVVPRVLRLKPGHKFCLLGQLSHEVGWHHLETIQVRDRWQVAGEGGCQVARDGCQVAGGD